MTVSASFTDPGFDFAPAGTEENFTALIEWGDGTSVSFSNAEVNEIPGGPGTETTGSFVASHTYADNDTYTVTVTGTSACGAVQQDSSQVEVIEEWAGTVYLPLVVRNH